MTTHYTADDGTPYTGEEWRAVATQLRADLVNAMSALEQRNVENGRLRKGLEEMLVVDMAAAQYEDDGTSTLISDGWACGHCDLGDGNADRPYAAERELVTHVATCPLYRAGPDELGAMLAELEQLRKRVELYEVLHDICAKCEAALHPMPTCPPHCDDCIVDDEAMHNWDDRVAALSEGKDHG